MKRRTFIKTIVAGVSVVLLPGCATADQNIPDLKPGTVVDKEPDLGLYNPKYEEQLERDISSARLSAREEALRRHCLELERTALFG